MQALPRERSIHRFLLPTRPPPDNREILLRDALLLHQQSETARRNRCLGNEHEAARFAIEPINDGNLSAVGDFKSEQAGKFAPECWRPVRFRRMHQQQRRFLDHDEIVALGHDGENGWTSCVSLRTGG